MIPKNAYKFCERGRVPEIENYELALADPRPGAWVCHHKLGESQFTKAQLIEFGLYENRTPGELIFMPYGEHSRLHGKHISLETRQKMSEAMKGKHFSNMSRAREGKVFSEFGRKFFEHFGFTHLEAPKQYKRENEWYRKYGHCRWEK